MTEHAARNWVEARFPSETGNRKAMLILAYGAGMDAGMTEVQWLLNDAIELIQADAQTSGTS